MSTGQKFIQMKLPPAWLVVLLQFLVVILAVVWILWWIGDQWGPG